MLSATQVFHLHRKATTATPTKGPAKPPSKKIHRSTFLGKLQKHDSLSLPVTENALEALSAQPLTLVPFTLPGAACHPARQKALLSTLRDIITHPYTPHLQERLNILLGPRWAHTQTLAAQWFYDPKVLGSLHTYWALLFTLKTLWQTLTPHHTADKIESFLSKPFSSFRKQHLNYFLSQLAERHLTTLTAHTSYVDTLKAAYHHCLRLASVSPFALWFEEALHHSPEYHGLATYQEKAYLQEKEQYYERVVHFLTNHPKEQASLMTAFGITSTPDFFTQSPEEQIQQIATLLAHTPLVDTSVWENTQIQQALGRVSKDILLSTTACGAPLTLPASPDWPLLSSMLAHYAPKNMQDERFRQALDQYAKAARGQSQWEHIVSTFQWLNSHPEATLGKALAHTLPLKQYLFYPPALEKLWQTYARQDSEAFQFYHCLPTYFQHLRKHYVVLELPVSSATCCELRNYSSTTLNALIQHRQPNFTSLDLRGPIARELNPHLLHTFFKTAYGWKQLRNVYIGDFLTRYPWAQSSVLALANRYNHFECLSFAGARLDTQKLENLLDRLYLPHAEFLMQSLDLSDNFLTDDSLEILLRYYPWGKLEELDLCGNFFSNAAVNRLLKALDHRTNLKVIHWGKPSNVSMSLQRAIREKLLSRYRIEELPLPPASPADEEDDLSEITEEEVDLTPEEEQTPILPTEFLEEEVIVAEEQVHELPKWLEDNPPPLEEKKDEFPAPFHSSLVGEDDHSLLLPMSARQTVSFSPFLAEGDPSLVSFSPPLVGESARSLFSSPSPLVGEGARSLFSFPSPLVGEGAQRAGEGEPKHLTINRIHTLNALEDNLLDFLKHIPHHGQELTELTLVGYPFTPILLENLLKALAALPDLQILRFPRCNLGSILAEALPEANRSKDSSETMHTLCRLLPHFPTLHTLDLRGNRLNKGECRLLRAMIGHMPQLMELPLDATAGTIKKQTKIIRALEKNRTRQALTKLHTARATDMTHHTFGTSFPFLPWPKPPLFKSLWQEKGMFAPRNHFRKNSAETQGMELSPFIFPTLLEEGSFPKEIEESHRLKDEGGMLERISPSPTFATRRAEAAEERKNSASEEDEPGIMLTTLPIISHQKRDEINSPSTEYSIDIHNFDEWDPEEKEPGIMLTSLPTISHQKSDEVNSPSTEYSVDIQNFDNWHPQAVEMTEEVREAPPSPLRETASSVVPPTLLIIQPAASLSLHDKRPWPFLQKTDQATFRVSKDREMAKNETSYEGQRRKYQDALLGYPNEHEPPDEYAENLFELLADYFIAHRLAAVDVFQTNASTLESATQTCANALQGVPIASTVGALVTLGVSYAYTKHDQFYRGNLRAFHGQAKVKKGGKEAGQPRLKCLPNKLCSKFIIKCGHTFFTSDAGFNTFITL